MATQIIEERFTARTLLKWRPSELRLVQEWCRTAKVDVSLLIRGAAVAVVRNPLRAVELLSLPAEVVERIQQSELPLDVPPEAGKPAQKPKKRPRGRKEAPRHGRRV